ncbi:copper amine oxidase N-terminal domain-containing protein [Sinanaerobacter sp. ZZT-01]|uniref:copper amine oxidase N-terminal domain-containing protein n=1 Tax=Sinanaerobacter sp. ZZT-01 TaxID=3111540 RepID=UPI002D79858C|nr:copper amine oxidase N-terminal domain-containing protein [Sinanaerobacter sp. ZZT-01]WRR94651.1 copper amine oxidase N-terminal domain-containing protein [Sinanaerobacter sp. ZZT-01]
MKKTAVILCALLMMLIGICGCSNSEPPSLIGSTNVDGLEIQPNTIGTDEAHITYSDGVTENIPEEYVALFINGSIMKHEGIQIQDGVPMLPIKLISEELNQKVSSDGESILISGDSNEIKLLPEEKKAILDDEEYTLEIAPKFFGKTLLVGLNDLSKLLNVDTVYYDGTDESETHIIQNLPQVMISTYPDEINSITKEEALEILKEQLITAYENQFGEFTEQKTKPALTNENNEMLRYIISNLSVTSENDRYYVIPVVFDFWIDKYTGEVYVYYNGLVMTVHLFDPNSENALVFAG